MSISLAAIAAAVGTAISSAESAVVGFEELKDYVVKFMDDAEGAFATQEAAGSTKLATVLAAAAVVAADIGVAWNSGLESALTSFITAAKGIYNSTVTVVNAVEGKAPAAAVVAAPVAVAPVASAPSAAVAS